MDTLAQFNLLIADLSAKMTDFAAKTSSDGTADASLKDAQASKDQTAKDLEIARTAAAASYKALTDFETKLGILTST